MTTTTPLIEAKTNRAELAESSALRRRPRPGFGPRSQLFHDRFEQRILFYDCFRHHLDNDVLLVGPAPLNLESELRASRFIANPGGESLVADHHISRSTMLTRLADVPAGARSITCTVGDDRMELDIQPNLSDAFEGLNVLMTMSRNNDAVWITDWIDYHRQVHNADGLIFFDNGSDAYARQDLENLLAESGLTRVALISWPYRYGARDPGVLMTNYWAHFLQVAALNLSLRRFGRRAKGLLNCDIDELVAPLPGSDVFELAGKAEYGLASLAGQWVSSATHDGRPGRRHQDYFHLKRGIGRKLCPRKWVLDPQREWLENYDVFPYVHRIFNTPDKATTQTPRGNFWHIEAISTNWKQRRRKTVRADRLTHFEDRGLKSVLNSVKWG